MRALIAIAALAACSSYDTGIEAMMRVDGAQFFRGRPPAPTDGPTIETFAFSASRAAPGMKSRPASGNVPKSTTAIAVYLDGDIGYWVFEPGATDPQELSSLTFTVKLSFAPNLPEGMHTVIAQAANAAGHFGPEATADLLTPASVPNNPTLLVSLSWDTQSDLDLHLVTPGGAIIWAKNIDSVDPTMSSDWMSGGILDFDSNSNCQIDGRRQENIYWITTPPSGHYIARVDAYSLCGEAQAAWTVTVSGAATGRASGFMHDHDTAYPHDANAGVTAVEFDIP